MGCVTRLQVLRGTRVQRLSIVPLEGELIYDTTEKKLYIGDGVTAGGVDPTLSDQLRETVEDLFSDIFSAIQSTTLSFNYDDANNLFTGDVIPSGINHQTLSNVGVYNHTSIDNHIDDLNNPHQVTKTQVGLSNVDNTSDADKPVSTAQAAAISIVQNDIDNHEARTDNPHSVTKSQVGLGNADNTSDMDKPVSTAQGLAIASVQSDVDNHKLRNDNPHSVTKSQVGLGNVDNTSDMNKPVSTAQAAAINSGDASTLSSAQNYTDSKIADLIDSSPATLDTLNEIAQALGDDPNFATTMTTALSNRLRVDTDSQGLNSTQKTNAKTNIDLENVDNTSDMNKPVSTAQASAINAVQSNLNYHTSDTSNPHSVTKSQVGLGNVDNTSDINKPVSTAQAAAINLVQSNLDSHALNTSNPHSVTKAQVGLGNVDNTSDIDKPISTAQASALALKADKAIQINSGAGLIGGGDLSSSRTISMPNVGTAGTYGAANSWNQIITDAFGRVTSISSGLISILSSQVSDFSNSVRNVLLAGFSATNSAIVATDSIIEAFGKAQGQITTLFNRVISAGYGLTGGGNLTADRSFSVSLSNQSVNANNAITTTSGSYVLMTGMTITPAAGTYLVLFTACVSGANDNENINLSVYSGDSLVPESERSVVANVSGGLSNPNTTHLSVTSLCVTTVNGSQAIEGRWLRGAGTATAYYRHLQLIRIA